VGNGEVVSMYLDDMSIPFASVGTPGVPLSTEAGSHSGNVTVGQQEGAALGTGRWDGWFRGMVLDTLVWPKNQRLNSQKYLNEYVQDPATLHQWDDLQQYFTLS